MRTPVVTTAPADLAWVADALGPPADPGACYLTLPAAARPTALVLDDRRAVAAYLRLTSGRERALRRATRSATGAIAVRTGRWALRPERVQLPDAGTDRPSVLAGLAERLGRDDLPHALLLGSPRANRKPVVVLADDRGRAIGFAKVGWNRLTRELVVHEADVLARAASSSVLHRPPVLDRWTTEDRSVILVGDVAGGVPWWRPSGLGLPRLAAVVRAVHDLGRVTTGTLGDSGFATSLRSRAADLGGTAAGLVERILDRHGHTEVALGGVHGDFTPWNLRNRGPDVAVWDWERFEDSGPAGVDLIHHEFQRLLQVARRPFPEAVDEARRSCRALLVDAGARPGTEDAVAILHLLDLLLRYTNDLPDAPPGSPLAGRVVEVTHRLEEDLA